MMSSKARLMVALAAALAGVWAAPAEEGGDSTVSAILVIGGATPDDMAPDEDGNFINDAVAYVPSENTWYDIADMPTPRRAMGYTNHEGLLYVYGGWTDAGDDQGSGRAVAALEIYDPSSNTWRQGAEMPRPVGKMGHYYPAVDGRIYVGGGERPWRESRLDEFVVYDIADDSWEALDPMPETRTFPYVMANPHEPHLIHFVAGNTDAFHEMSDFHHVYDTRNGEWDTESYPPFPVGQTDGDGASMYDGYWWIMGGWNRDGHLNVTKAYDFEEDRWLEKPRPGSFDSWTHQATAVAEVDGEERLYKLGGRINGTVSDAVWYYDGEAWREAPTRMPLRRWNFVAVTMDLDIEQLEALEPQP